MARSFKTSSGGTGMGTPRWRKPFFVRGFMIWWERGKNVEPNLSYVARCSPRNRPFDSITVANIFPRTRTSSCYGNLDCIFVTDNDISVSCAIESRFTVRNKQLAWEWNKKGQQIWPRYSKLLSGNFHTISFVFNWKQVCYGKTTKLLESQ